MRRGEKGILILMAVSALGLLVYRGVEQAQQTEPDPGIPFYSTAGPELKSKAGRLYRGLKCRECHSLWGIRDMTANVPSPALDGIGSLRDEQWFYNYFSATDPQAILPTRLKEQYRMPSYAHLPEEERRVLAAYMASLKVEDWYLEETKKSEYEKLTGRTYQPGHDSQDKTSPP